MSIYNKLLVWTGLTTAMVFIGMMPISPEARNVLFYAMGVAATIACYYSIKIRPVS